MSLAVERFDARPWPESELDLLFEGAFPVYITAGQVATAYIGRSVRGSPSGTPSRRVARRAGLPGAGGGVQGGLNDCLQWGALELVAMTTGIVPERMSKKVCRHAGPSQLPPYLPR